jgi:hypothetical protein
MAVATGGPPQGGQGRRVLIPKVGERWQARFLGPLIVPFPSGLWVHPWIEQFKRGKPCSGDGCEWCAASFRQVWRTYAPVRAMTFVRKGIGSDGKTLFTPSCEVAEYALELWDSHAEQLDGLDLRGVLVEITRPDKFAAFRMEILETPETEAPTLPRSFDVRPVLCRFWNEPKAFDESVVKPKLKVWGGWGA